MNLINLKTGARVCSSSTKHNEILNRYRENDPNYRDATQLEYELAGLMATYGNSIVLTVLSSLIKEAIRLNNERVQS